MRIGFWNTHNNSINTYIAEFCVEQNLDLLALCEYQDNVSSLIHELSKKESVFYHIATPGCERITWLSNTQDISIGAQHERYSMLILNSDVILSAVHFPTIQYDDSETQSITIDFLLEAIQDYEGKLNTKQSIIFGDFNMDPYDNNCINAKYLHGIKDKKEAKRKKRRVSRKDYKMFYNPMWNYLGDHVYPPGTYYYKGSSALTTFWHTFDQVIIRPEMIDYFDFEQLDIITTIEGQLLFDSAFHPQKQISDHFPIVFEIQGVQSSC